MAMLNNQRVYGLGIATTIWPFFGTETIRRIRFVSVPGTSMQMWKAAMEVLF